MEKIKSETFCNASNEKDVISNRSESVVYRFNVSIECVERIMSKKNIFYLNYLHLQRHSTSHSFD